jgi:hypothetical protein
MSGLANIRKIATHAVLEIRYAVGLQQVSSVAVFRILALGMVSVLLQTVFLPANCMSIPTHGAVSALDTSKNCPGDTEQDAGCCSYCFCCHFAGVVNSTDPRLTLVAHGFLAPNWNSPPLQLSIVPFDKPPRA